MPNNKIYIGNLSSRTSKKDILRNFDFGEIIQCDLKEGFGFIEFSSKNDCDYAIRKMHRVELHGRRIIVEMSHSRGPRTYDNRGDFGTRGSYRESYSGRRRERDNDYRNDRNHYSSNRRNFRVTVRNLSSKVSWQDLKDFARDNIGNSVVRTDVWSDSRGNNGMIEFSNREHYDQALDNLSGKQFHDRKIEVSTFSRDDEEALRRNSRRGSPRRSYSPKRYKRSYRDNGRDHSSRSSSRYRGRDRKRSRVSRRDRSEEYDSRSPSDDRSYHKKKASVSSRSYSSKRSLSPIEKDSKKTKEVENPPKENSKVGEVNSHNGTNQKNGSLEDQKKNRTSGNNDKQSPVAAEESESSRVVSTKTDEQSTKTMETENVKTEEKSVTKTEESDKKELGEVPAEDGSKKAEIGNDEK